MKNKMSTKHYFFIVLSSILFVILSCNNDTPNAEKTNPGSASFSIKWIGNASSSQGLINNRAANIDCTGLGITTIDVKVYTGTNAYLTGAQFECAAGKGTINNIEPGSDRKFVVLGSDANGNVLYRGEMTGISIIKGKNIDVGTIDAFAFVLDLLVPIQDALISKDAIILQWTNVPGATDYRLMVSDDSTFQSGTLIDTYVGGTSYSLQGSSSADYYWKVIPRDFDGNSGIESETRRFTVMPNGPLVSIEMPLNESVYVEGETITFSGTGTDDTDGDLTGGDLVWLSSVDNQIGLGKSFTTTLSAGIHTITLTGTNSSDINGIVSIKVSVQAVWYKDADGDLHSDGTMVTSASSPSSQYAKASQLTALSGDCNDSNASIHPGMTEVCLDEIDNDCNPGTDDACDLDGDGVLDDQDLCPNTESGDPVDANGCSATQIPTWYRDADEDGYGDADDIIESFSQPSGYVSNNTDCNDGSNSVYPGATETLNDGIDQDCDGGDLKAWYADTDGDNYGDAAASTTANTQPANYVADNTDCDDNNSGRYPGLGEVLDDGIDQDCDGFDLKTWYADTDTDSFGDPDSSQTSNTQPGGYVLDNTDCDDTDNDVNPNIVERCGDGIDQNCDGDDPVCSITNSLGMTLNYIPEGTFMMGSPQDELGRNENEVQHQVTLTQPYYMQTTEVTQGQWQAVMGNNPSNYSSCGSNCPVEMVTWYDVQDFFTAIYTLGEGTYRLPTEAEWEYAARAESTTAFAIGDITATDCGYDPILDLIGWYCYNASEPKPVAQKGPNDWGLYDMHGNVHEWIQDWGTFDLGQTPVVDPQGPSIGDEKIIRSGSFNEPASSSRSAYRQSWAPYTKYTDGGFRVVLVYRSDQVPVAPENLAVTAGNSQTTLTWQKSTGAAIYNCYMHNSSGVSKSVYSAKDVTSSNTYTWVNLTNGTTYYFIVTAENSIGESDESNILQSTPYDTGNNPSTLSNASVTPISGTNLDPFTFSVNYYDPDGDPPTSRIVYINEIPYSMNYASGTFSNGTYSYQTTLEEGAYTYCFKFSDGNGNISRIPPTGSYVGPNVTAAIINVTGRILYDGEPLQDHIMQIDDVHHSVSLDPSITNAEGIYYFPIVYDPSAYWIIRAVSYNTIPETALDSLDYQLSTIDSTEIIVPEIDIKASIIFSPSDNAAFTADEISDSNPVMFGWTDGGNTFINEYEIVIEKPQWNDVWNGGLTSSLSTAFDGILNSGDKITPGTYYWYLFFSFDGGWYGWTERKTIIIE